MLIVVVVVIAVRAGGNERSAVASYLAVAAVVLVVPDVIRLSRLLLRTGRPSSFVARRLLQTGLWRHGLAGIVVASCVAVPAAAATQLASEKASDAALTYNRVPAGQIWVQRTGDEGDVASVARIVARAIGTSAVPIRGLSAPPASNGRSGPVGRFARYPRAAHVGTDPMVVRSAAELRLVVGKALPPGTADVLARGGVVDFAGIHGAQRLVLVSADGQLVRSGRDLPTAHLTDNRQLAAQFGGAVLLSTALTLGTPVSEPNTYVFANSSPSAIERAVAATVDAGFDSEFVQYDVAPPEPRLPPVAYAFLVAMLIGGFGVLLLVVQAQARRLRSYGSLLVALGLKTRFAAGVLALQTGLVVVAGTVVGAVAGCLGIVVQSDAYAVVVVPVPQIVAAAAVTLILAGVAVGLASRRLTAREHIPQD